MPRARRERYGAKRWGRVRSAVLALEAGLERPNPIVQLLNRLDEGADQAEVVHALYAVGAGHDEVREDGLDILRDHPHSRRFLGLGRRLVAPLPRDSPQPCDSVGGRGGRAR
jgi:hypothetical protein